MVLSLIILPLRELTNFRKTIWIEVNKLLKKHKNTKIETNNKTKKYLESVKSNRDETDEQKITRLMAEGKTNPKAHYIFDQNGSLFMVTYDD